MIPKHFHLGVSRRSRPYELDLIKRLLFPKADVQTSKKPLNLRSANGQKRPFRSLYFGRLDTQQMLTEVMFGDLGFAPYVNNYHRVLPRTEHAHFLE